MNKWVLVLFLGFFGGVLARSFYNFGWSFAVLFIFLGILMAGIFYFLKFPKPIFFAGLFLLAFGLGMIRYEIKDAKNAVLENQIGSRISVKGMIIDEPEEKENYTRLIAETEEPKANILITTRRYPAYHYGDMIEINGVLKKPSFAKASADAKALADKSAGKPEQINDFDWPAYLAKDDIYFEIFYPQIKLLPDKGGSYIKRQLFSLKEKFISNLSAVVPEPDAGFLAGLTVGAKQAMPKYLLEDFRKVGIIHLVVLSGYNVTIVAYAIMAILKGLPLFAGIGFGVLGIVFFALMTGASATVVRAAIMAGIALLARATGRIYQIKIALVAAAFLMVLQNPKILRFDSSFQLSFLATIALIYLSPIVAKKLEFIPKKYGLREVASATTSTQIFVLPFILYKMGILSVVGLPVNLLILSFVPATMFFSFIAGGLGFISQIISVPFGWIAYGLSAYELWITNIFSKLPFSSFNIFIPFWLTLLIYAGYALVLYKLSKKKDASLD
ncbi:MAG: ComEC/Rec2 family competence protein [bacterium]|nr:ComEC/Rec2 family competence protein [bacterium]